MNVSEDITVKTHIKLKEKRITYIHSYKNFHFKKRGMIQLDLNFKNEGNN